MGSKLTRQSSLDSQATFFRMGRQHHERDVEKRRGGRGEFLFSSLMLKSDKLPGMLRKSSPSPYVRRVAWVREIQTLLKEQKVEQAIDVLKLLRKLFITRFSSFWLFQETDALKSSEKICRQLIYHLTPHSKWCRQNVPRRKSQACLKTTLKKKLTNDIVDLSAIPLSGRDLHRVAYYLQNNGSSVTAVDISFTELQDESLRLLLPFLGVLPKLTTLAINGNRLTLAILKDLIEVVKDPKKFPSLAWVDLGNNVDIFTVPQPLLVALRRRFGMRSSLPTIYENSEGQGSSYFLETSIEEISVFEEEEEDEEDELEDHLVLEPWSVEEKNTLHYCER
ncbi:leucine-rich repeat-containing protein 75B-like [Sinocyclocheilus anshuiensis]|uniref:Leucine-rich repeat-containing protein 75B-like n=1 Tax=Sinocyclocheilus anshuiensis TaxID=1608454 RepID=A0A671L0N0_9TELE|nr:PREDICTED: leucine-rich repeat-containing protein 75B-like [Sinocyclocheilus anshuiensis]